MIAIPGLRNKVAQPEYWERLRRCSGTSLRQFGEKTYIYVVGESGRRRKKKGVLLFSLFVDADFFVCLAVCLFACLYHYDSV